jgi:hypothetical protein
LKIQDSLSGWFYLSAANYFLVFIFGSDSLGLSHEQYPTSQWTVTTYAKEKLVFATGNSHIAQQTYNIA